MSAVAALLDRVPWFVVVMACATIGLAPFTPPHIVEKLRMFVAGRLVKPIDILDFALHGAPWLLLLAKSIRSLVVR